MANLKIIVALLFIVIIGAAAFGAYEMEIGPFEEDDDDDNGGQTDITENKPVAIIAKDKTHADVGEVITFNGSDSYDDETNITSYLWDFDDGNTEDNMTVEHNWIQPGAFNVSLSVTDSDGNFNKTWIYIGITYRDAQNDTLNSGSVQVGFEVKEMAAVLYVNQTVENNVEDIDNNDITLSIMNANGTVWTQDIQNGWQEQQSIEFMSDTNLTVGNWAWEIELTDSGFVGSIDWGVEIVILYV